ncbi:hypothetical protein EDB86DRAFT_489443 [Lactarius hatsudake]|nr:hypothetical protein EDB86DRAFT_489443 [Lactarius hatsudake]
MRGVIGGSEHALKSSSRRSTVQHLTNLTSVRDKSGVESASVSLLSLFVASSHAAFWSQSFLYSSRKVLVIMPPSMKPSRSESQFGEAAGKVPNDSDVVEEPSFPLVTRIHIHDPQLNGTFITSLKQLIAFLQLVKFFDRLGNPEITLFGHAYVTFSGHLHHADPSTFGSAPCRDDHLCQGVDYQVSHIAQVLSYLSSTLSKLKVRLKEPRQLGGTDDVE